MFLRNYGYKSTSNNIRHTIEYQQLFICNKRTIKLYLNLWSFCDCVLSMFRQPSLPSQLLPPPFILQSSGFSHFFFNFSKVFIFLTHICELVLHRNCLLLSQCYCFYMIFNVGNFFLQKYLTIALHRMEYSHTNSESFSETD